MEIKAVVTSSAERHDVVVRTGASSRSLNIPSTSSGGGSGVSGGEFLMLAVATCYCNDLYREAERLGVPLDCVEVEASAEFPGEGSVVRSGVGSRTASPGDRHRRRSAQHDSGRPTRAIRVAVTRDRSDRRTPHPHCRGRMPSLSSRRS